VESPRSKCDVAMDVESMRGSGWRSPGSRHRHLERGASCAALLREAYQLGLAQVCWSTILHLSFHACGECGASSIVLRAAGAGVPESGIETDAGRRRPIGGNSATVARVVKGRLPDDRLSRPREAIRPGEGSVSVGFGAPDIPTRTPPGTGPTASCVSQLTAVRRHS
jgi:hypothetical protein